MLAFGVILIASSLLIAAGGEDVSSNDQNLSLNSKDVATSVIPETGTTKKSTEIGANSPVTTTTEKVIPTSKSSTSTKSLPSLTPTSSPPKQNSSATPASGKGKRTLTESHFPIPFISFVVISLTGVVLFFVYKRATDARWR